MTELVELDPSDDAALAELLDLGNAAGAVDSPWNPPLPLHYLVAGIRHPWHGDPSRYWLLRERSGGTLIGRLVLNQPDKQNRHLARIGVVIHPSYRRSGHGRRLFEHGRALAASSGRRLLTAHALDIAAGNGFASALGFSPVSADVHRRQDLSTVDLAQVRSLRESAEAAASDYRLLRIVGPVPDDLIDAYTVMYAAINDAPTGDLDIEPTAIDTERVRVYERSQSALGATLYQLVAQRVSDGELAGHTVVAYDPERPEWAGQHNTSVLAAHRGHRLGLLLKASMIEWIVDELPKVRYLDTNNAESNYHMIRINDQLGYNVVARYVAWQQQLPS
ncbi:GNAT family N-acetyltransferase [Flindersiella endophytica]